MLKGTSEDLQYLKAEKDSGKLTVVVTYKTRYHTSNGEKITLSFGLGEAIKVNTMLGLPTFRALKLVLDVDDAKVTYKLLSIDFELCFQHAASGFPAGVKFDRSNFVRPIRKNTTGLALLAHCAESTLPTGVSSADNNGVIIKTNNGPSYYTKATYTSEL